MSVTWNEDEACIEIRLYDVIERDKIDIYITKETAKRLFSDLQKYLDDDELQARLIETR